jgi:HPt (histidine-containing phosphotransfer) domain-containing protein
MATYILLSIVLLILALLIFSENRDKKPSKNDKSPEQLNLEARKKADAEKRVEEEAKKAKAETKKRLEASQKAAKEQKATEEAARKAEEAKKAEAAKKIEEAKAKREAEKAEAERKAQEEAEKIEKEKAEALKREAAAALKAEEERKAKEETLRLEAEKRAAEKAEKEARERIAAEAEAQKKAEIKAKKEEAAKKAAIQKAEKEKATLPKLPDYPAFDHSRLLEMGLSDEDAKEFVQELITQIETEIPLIKEAMVQKDFHQMERVTHGIKGSSTNVGTGGVSDLIIEYNTYLKTGDDIQVAQSYFEALKNELEKLKAQYL